MGVTTKGLRYPEATDRINLGNVAIQNLATDVDGKLPGANQSGTATVGTGWAAGSETVVLRRFQLPSMGYWLVFFTLNITRTGTTLTPSATGNLTDETVLTFPAGYRPLTLTPVSMQVVSKAPALGRIGADGIFVLQSQSPGSSIATNDLCRLAGSFMSSG